MTSPSFDILCGNGISAAGACLSAPFLHHRVFFVCSGTLCGNHNLRPQTASQFVRECNFHLVTTRTIFAPQYCWWVCRLPAVKVSSRVARAQPPCPSPPPLVAGSALYFPRDPVLGFNSDQTRLTSRLGAPPPLVAPLSLLLFHGGRWGPGAFFYLPSSSPTTPLSLPSALITDFPFPTQPPKLSLHPFFSSFSITPGWNTQPQ